MNRKSRLVEIADPIIKKIYKLTLDFPYKYQSSLGDQLRRSSLSVILNIVESGARLYPKEKNQLLNVAFGSLKETKYLLYFSKSMGIIEEKIYLSILLELDSLAKLLYGILYKK